MMDCWHTQLRLVEKYLPGPFRVRKGYSNPDRGIFVYVTPAPRAQACPANVIETFRALGYAIIRVEESRK